MTKTVAVFGGSFNPPAVRHRALAERLTDLFDAVVIVPCGPRPDKEVTNDVAPMYRAAMVDMAFRSLPKVRVDLFDLEENSFTRTHRLAQRYQKEGEVWHVVDAGLVKGGANGMAPIQTDWERGNELWRQNNFVVTKPLDETLELEDLPPNHRVVEVEVTETSAAIRDRVFHHRPVQGLVVPEVARYMERHRLYRGMRPPRTTHVRLEALKPLITFDAWNPEAVALAEGLGDSHETDPNLIVVIGGDGTMLRAIRQHWRRRVPFYGINVGHMGFLLNRAPPALYLGQTLVLEQPALLWVETVGAAGEVKTTLAFNDAWVERATGQTAWLRVKVDDEERLPRLVADGALVATAAGSTSYARAMGGPALPLNTPALVLVGSNVLSPDFWKPAVLSWESVVELTTLDPDKRPLHGFVDGTPQGEVRGIKARVSNIATVELAFEPGHHPAKKLARIQFPLET